MNFWHGRRVLVTGHTGFKGGWLSLWLKLLGAEVHGIALPPSEPSFYSSASIDEELHSNYCDIRDLSGLRKILQMVEPEVIFHLAAQPLVRTSYDDPVTTYETNVMGTVNLLEAARQTPHVKAILVITTDKCYENKEWEWGYREIDSLGGHDPYSSSKACAELVVNSFRCSFFNGSGINVATARAGNVIGGGDWGDDRLVPDLLAGYAKNIKVNIRNPGAVRPWQHVCEPLSGYLRLAYLLSSDQGLKFCEAWNFGPYDDSNKTVSWVADYLTRKLPQTLSWSSHGGDEPYESKILKLDISKSISRLGWHPTLRVSQALDWTIDWYKSYLGDADMKKISIEQLTNFTTVSSKSSDPCTE